MRLFINSFGFIHAFRRLFIHTCILTRILARILARIPTCIPMRIENDVSVFELMLFQLRFAVASMPNCVERMTSRIDDCCSVPRRRAGRVLLLSPRLVDLERNSELKGEG